MAHLNQKRSQNVDGDFYVDSSCIDCDTCRWMAPGVFTEAEGQSAVYHQPENQDERRMALQALLACPTGSIGTVEKPQDIKDAQLSFPILVEDNIYDCGYHSEKSYAATSYFIRLPEGNILVDSPRFTPPLVKQLEKLGGIKYMYLTHRDDVADHEKFAAHFHCNRILHKDDITSGTKDVEIQLTGGDVFGSDIFGSSADLMIIPVPGHSKGHTVLLYNRKYLFTGDHLAWSEKHQQLVAFRDFCWYSFSEQIKSMQNLANYNFEWILPGHGRRYHADRKTMGQQMQKCVEWMETV
jgi:glyoxylase-like metal-dependent hydrolase (beta-lactamase superfamily II)/ferredoxin